MIFLFACISELELRRGVARQGENVEETRDMAEQSPYLINAYVSYDYKPANITANLSYNVQGESLIIISSQSVLDVYAVPFHSMNFTLSTSLGVTNQWRLTLRT